MQKFTKDETERLNKILSMEVNPFLTSEESGSSGLPLGEASKEWLFTTRMNLPPDSKKHLQELNFDELSDEVKVHLLNELLEERQMSSAPQWWELNFFEANVSDLWSFFVEQCRNHYSDVALQEYFDLLVRSFDELREARQILSVSKINKTKYSELEIQNAMEVFDRSYPLDFRDYNEAPKKTRSPLQKIQELISVELSELGAVFT